MAAQIFWAEPGCDATFDTSFYDVIGGSVSASGAHAKDGNHSLLLARGSSCSKTGILTDAGFRLAFWFYFDYTGSLGAGTPLIFQGLTSGFSGARLDVGFTTGTSYKLQMSTTVGNSIGTAVLAPNGWNHLCLVGQRTSASSWRFDLYVNGVLDISRDSLNASQLGGFDTLRFQCTTNIPVGGNHYFDNIVVEQSVTPADGGSPLYRVSAKRPIANGINNTFDTTTSIDSSGYGTGSAVYVNQRPLSVNGARRQNALSGGVDENFAIEDITVGDRDLSSASGLFGYVSWVQGSGVATDTIWSNGVAAVPPVPFSGSAAVRYRPTTSSSYPSSSSCVGMGRPTGSATNAILNECGLLVVFTANGDAITPGVDGGLPSIFQVATETPVRQASASLQAQAFQTPVETIVNQAAASVAAQVFQIAVEVLRPFGCTSPPSSKSGCPTDLEFPTAPGDGAAGCSDELPVS